MILPVLADNFIALEEVKPFAISNRIIKRHQSKFDNLGECWGKKKCWHKIIEYATFYQQNKIKSFWHKLFIRYRFKRAAYIRPFSPMRKKAARFCF